MIRPERIAFVCLLLGAHLLGGTWSALLPRPRPRTSAFPADPRCGRRLPGPVQPDPSARAAGDPQAPQTVKMTYSAASGRARIEQPSMPGYMLIDRAGGHLTVVMDQLQTFMDMPFDAKAGAGLLLNDKMGFVRAGTDKVAGLPCTEWDVTSDQNHRAAVHHRRRGDPARHRQ